MQHDEFIGYVQDRARLSSRGDAERLTRAVLEVLAERLQGGEAADLASQLPEEIGRHLTKRTDAAETAERFSLEDFYQRVSERAGADYPFAVHHAKATISVLDDAVTGGEMADVRTQLGPDFAELFAFETASD